MMVVIASALHVLPVTGYVPVFGLFDGFGASGVHVHLMHGLGWIMIGLFALLYWRFWQQFRQAVDLADGEAAATALAGIRRIVASNLGLALLVVAFAAAGRYWP